MLFRPIYTTGFRPNLLYPSFEQTKKLKVPFSFGQCYVITSICKSKMQRWQTDHVQTVDACGVSKLSTQTAYRRVLDIDRLPDHCLEAVDVLSFFLPLVS
ncbi:hypothetical protein AVEN_33662-1 [Araneus ventricosus]|uniref:Uncharacterized protein n=1 Tax=Araneus ventricosus TaxID=182803 RepID=A0A4Y2NFA0_ARAVE|nr:hypothetical protein AVEN_33662-1 [Araneus ventricosus]